LFFFSKDLRFFLFPRLSTPCPPLLPPAGEGHNFPPFPVPITRRRPPPPFTPLRETGTLLETTPSSRPPGWTVFLVKLPWLSAGRSPPPPPERSEDVAPPLTPSPHSQKRDFSRKERKILFSPVRRCRSPTPFGIISLRVTEPSFLSPSS